MHVFARIVGVMFMVGANTASASHCARALSDGGESSSSTARSLITYVEHYWEVAVTGKPDSISVSVVDDPSGDGGTIDFYSVQFRNFHAGFYRYPDGTPMPSELSTTSPSFKLPCGLKVGQSQMKVEALLGTPTYVQAESYTYATGGDQNGEVIFKFKQGKLRNVTWKYDTH
ncbi:hypothetical protein [Duganella sp. HH105]|uniref:hypothetical protein n=1 Tax=Duganella sp. HH105 TaxID=1781067 RepID=UPI00114D3978|nr:hypothetical protein [Duganella sp. HH105]